jgi:uncharacterized membrane protein
MDMVKFGKDRSKAYLSQRAQRTRRGAKACFMGKSWNLLKVSLCSQRALANKVSGREIRWKKNSGIAKGFKGWAFIRGHPWLITFWFGLIWLMIKSLRQNEVL